MSAVQLLDVNTRDGLVLTGAFYEPAGPTRADAPIDAVLMVHGNGANFYTPYQRDFAQRLSAVGYPVLCANTRGHGMLSMAVRAAGVPGCVGTSLERIDDCLLDLDAWLDRLRSQGFSRILLWGHSRGAVKVAYHLAHGACAGVARAVLSSPPLLSHARWMASERAYEFRALLARCAAAMAEQGADALVPVSMPLDYLSGASQYLDSYGPQEKYNLLALLDAMDRPVPMLAITGTLEALHFFPFQGLPELLQAYAQRQPCFQHLSVPQGDHVYSGQREWVTQQVQQWLHLP